MGEFLYTTFIKRNFAYAETLKWFVVVFLGGKEQRAGTNGSTRAGRWLSTEMFVRELV